MAQKLNNQIVSGGESEMVFSVGEYITAINAIVKNFKAKITGEITVAKIYPSGHCYFTIKDNSPQDNNETAKTSKVLECIIFKYDYQMCGVQLTEGLEVVLTGAGQVYEATGKFSFVAKTVELKGEGALKKAYEQLKSKLEKQGLFAPENKKPLPMFPQKIGIITSRQGAVIHDFLNNIGKFGFKITMVDSRVEGQEAIGDLLGAIAAFKKQDIDVLVIMRGGGSLESLQPFNNEVVIQAIAGFKAPIIAAIGHDKDVPLLALAADFMCSTPTAAANTISKTWEMAPQKIVQFERLIIEKFSQIIFSTNSALWQTFNNVAGGLTLVFNKYKQMENTVSLHLAKIDKTISSQKIATVNLAKIILNKSQTDIKTIIQQLYSMAKLVQANDPQKNLALGYCIARKNNKIAKNIQDFKVNDNFDLQMQDGIVNSTVVELKNYNS